VCGPEIPFDTDGGTVILPAIGTIYLGKGASVRDGAGFDIRFLVKY
jgi:hypothetical protein